MLRWIAIALVLAACDEGASEFEASPATEPTKPGSAGGFSADLAKSMGSDGKKPEAGSAVAEAGSAKPEAGGAVAEAGSAKPPESAKPDKPEVKPDKPEPEAGSGSGAVAGAKPPESAKPDKPDAIKPVNLDAPRVQVKPPPELAAIKLSLEPNWDRDVGEAGTISLVVRVPNTDKTRVFSWSYGYEDAKAPTDREAYKKWLADNKILTTTLDRQRGGAWYIEGTDGRGAPAFRIIVNYGGKKLVCGGSLYKDPISNQLGDIRDKTIVQAKEICESVAL